MDALKSALLDSLECVKTLSLRLLSASDDLFGLLRNSNDSKCRFQLQEQERRFLRLKEEKIAKFGRCDLALLTVRYRTAEGVLQAEKVYSVAKNSKTEGDGWEKLSEVVEKSMGEQRGKYAIENVMVYGPNSKFFYDEMNSGVKMAGGRIYRVDLVEDASEAEYASSIKPINERKFSTYTFQEESEGQDEHEGEAQEEHHNDSVEDEVFTIHLGKSLKEVENPGSSSSKSNVKEREKESWSTVVENSSVHSSSSSSSDAEKSGYDFGEEESYELLGEEDPCCS